jgi:hypothetical protein
MPGTSERAAQLIPPHQNAAAAPVERSDEGRNLLDNVFWERARKVG